MSEDDKAQPHQQEPSMEDILASIRRILSEEGEGEARAGESAPSESASSESAPSESAPDEAARSNAAPPAGPTAAPASPPRGEPAAAASAAPAEAERGAAPASGDAAAAEQAAPASEIEFADAKEPEAAETGLKSVLDLTPEMRLGPVVSSPTAVAATDVLAQLAKAILDRRDIGVGQTGVTLEGMVREMLRPLLKEWLDRNLPYLIERLVKKEIDAMINRAERLED